METRRQISSLKLLEGGETVLLISPQPWEGFRVSKHHYAIELAKAGNRVIFLDPPVFNRFPGAVQTIPTTILGLSRIEYQPPLPYLLRFHARPVFDIGMQLIARRIRARIGSDLSVVWDFDNTGSFKTLRWFQGVFRIFHPVDQLPPTWTSAKAADLVFSVASTIAACLGNEGVPIHIIPHGLGDLHSRYAREQLDRRRPTECRSRGPVSVGYVGNLASRSVDRETIERFVYENPEVRFEFFGPYASSPPDAPLDLWITRLKGASNCTFHGLTPSNRILEQAPRIHFWFLCYDSTLDINGGANSHKILEYLATGSQVISSHLDAYQNLNLLHMPDSKSNQELPAIFKRQISSWPHGDSEPQRRRRLEFALSHTYTSHLLEIQTRCNSRINALNALP